MKNNDSIVNDKFICRLLFADPHAANVVSECARHFLNNLIIVNVKLLLTFTIILILIICIALTVASMKNEIKAVIKLKAIKCIFLAFLLVFAIWFHIAACKTSFYHYVDDLVGHCFISDLDECVEYSLLSSKIKKYINKDDLKFTTDEEVFSLAQKLQKIDYEDIPDSKSTWSKDYFCHDDLFKNIDIDGKYYRVSFSLTYTPNYFSFISREPKIIRFKATIEDMS